MQGGGRQAQCPNCGGPIEWKLGSSAALVCPFCSFAVVRTDRDVRAVGKVADLVPTAAVMAVGDYGRIGDQGFTVGGRLQLDHGAGPWDEWYVSLDDGRWGWLAKAQGRWYLTFPQQASNVPHYEAMTPGNSGKFPGGGDVEWTATERGNSVVVSAEGELPFASVSGERGRYVDLHGPGGYFATIDYGDGSEAPKLYIGRQYEAGDIQFQHGGMGPRPEEKLEVGKLNCPTCGGPIPIMVPDQTERAACPNCSSLLDFSHGNLTFLEQLNQQPIEPYIPLGSTGQLDGEEVMCIGFMERCVVVDGVTYAWREYLMHADAGYRWLLEDSNHFTYVRPANPAEVRVSGNEASYANRKHKLFSTALTNVTFVIGEFYWKVRVGDQAEAADYIAPPHILSEERTTGEVQWSAGRYMEGKEIWQAFGLPGSPPKPYDVAPAQPNPIKVTFPIVFSLVALALLAGIFFLTKKNVPIVTLVDTEMAIPAVPEQAMIDYGQKSASQQASLTPNLATSGPSVNVTFSEPFTLPQKADTVRIGMTSNMGSGWLGVACALINQDTGKAVEFLLEQDDFQSSSAAVMPTGRSTTADVGGLDPGTYVLRVDPRWARKPTVANANTPPAANIRVSTTNAADDGNAGCCCMAGFVLFLPVPFAFIRRRLFEGRRWRNSNVV